MKYAFIRYELAGGFMVRMACRLLEVGPNGCYCLLKTSVAARKVRRLAVADAVVCIHAESRLQGVPRSPPEARRGAEQRSRIRSPSGYACPEAIEAAARSG